MERRTGSVTGTVTERDGRHERHGISNREREGPSRSGQVAETEDESSYVGRGCAGVLGVYTGGPIQFGTYNICNGWNGGMKLALKVISQANT